MDINTALKLFNMYDSRPMLTYDEEVLLEEAIEVLEDNGLIDDDGNLVDEDKIEDALYDES
jgi:hypothetical protein